MAFPKFRIHALMAFGLAAALAACGGGGDSSSTPAADATKAATSARAASAADASGTTIRIGHGSKETLLVGTADQKILQLGPHTGRLLATLSVDTWPSHIVADEHNIFFGGVTERYDLATRQLVSFAFNDGYTGAVGMAIAPSGTLFASNMYYFRPDTSCGTCSTMLSLPDPNGADPVGRSNYFFGYVRPLAGGEGVLSGQQIGFTSDARLLVASKAGDGIFVSDVPVEEICCGPNAISFLPLVVNPANTVMRFALRGEHRLLVLHSTGRLDEHDLATGRLIRPILQAGTIDPIDFVVSQDGKVYVLEKPGRVRVFSDKGRERSTLVLPTGTGQALSLALCCGTTRQHGRGHWATEPISRP